MPRNEALKTRKPIRKRRKPRPGRLKDEPLAMLRLDCYGRDRGKCQACGRQTIFDAPKEWDDSYHMAHIKAKRIGLDTLSNVRIECGKCHRAFHNFGPSRTKPVPPKDAAVREYRQEERAA